MGDAMWEIVIKGNSYFNDFTRIEWSGGINGSARVLEVDYIPELKAEVGDKVEFKEDGITLFIGKIFTINRYANRDTFTFVAFDNAIYLNRNRFVKNIYNQQPSQILKQLCGEIGLEVGNVPQDKVKCSFPAINRSAYEIILQAYTIQHKKDKEIYSVVCDGEKIEIAYQGILLNTELNTGDVIREAEYTQSIEEMINQIVVYETKGEKLQILNKVSNEEDKKKYGVFQNVMEFDKEQNNLYNANEMLKGLDNKANIQVDGDTRLISGYTVPVIENVTGLIGKFLIVKDRHIIENGDYYTHLILSFENKMDKVEFDDFKRKAKKEKYTIADVTEK